MQRWATAPARWRKYQRILDADLKIRKELLGWQAHFGYMDRNHLEAACAIARRCAGAEEALRRIADNQEADARAAGLPGLTAGEIERLAVQVQLLKAGVLTVNEVRAMRGLSPLGQDGVEWKGNSAGIPIRIDLMLNAGDVRQGDVTHWYRSKRDAGAKGM